MKKKSETNSVKGKYIIITSQNYDSNWREKIIQRANQREIKGFKFVMNQCLLNVEIYVCITTSLFGVRPRLLELKNDPVEHA